MESEREKERERERERGKRGMGRLRRTYDVHLLAFHVGLTWKWKILKEIAERNNEDEYIFLKYSLLYTLSLDKVS